MNKYPSIIWLLLLLIIILPTAAGRVFVDIAGGLLILFLAIPIILTGAGWIGWRIIQSKMVKCEVCGISIMNSNDKCPFCGANIEPKSQNKSPNPSIPASAATIDITPTSNSYEIKDE